MCNQEVKNTDIYSWNAVDYEKHSSNQKQWGFEVVSKLHLVGNENVLDIGCGDGKITANIAGIISEGSIIGIDNSENMIALTQQLYSSNSHPNLQFRIMDARNLQFDNLFDIVVSTSALHWVLDHRPVLAGIYKSLRVGGRIFLQMGGKGNAEELFIAIEPLINSGNWRKYFINFNFPWGFYDDLDYKKWLIETGFSIKRVELIPKIMLHQNRNAFEGWIRMTWLQYINRIPKNMQDNFISDIAVAYLKSHPANENGMIRLKMLRLEAEAIKLN